LYLVTDTRICQQAGHTLEFVVAEACRAGVRWVQLREKTLSTRAFVELAVRIKSITERYQARLIINDRVDVVLAAEADGVHIGQEDMPFPLTQKLLPTSRIIGLSVNTLAETQAADTLAVDYLGVATVFPTATKTDTDSLLGLDGLAKLCAATRHPTYAIGGINAANIQQVIRTGVTGAAVVSAICGAPAPYDAARTLLQLIERA